jgi:hypothetical protein
VLNGKVRISCYPPVPSNILALKTERDHERVCGAFNYVGRVRFRDGLIVLKREPVSDPFMAYFQ